MFKALYYAVGDIMDNILYASGSRHIVFYNCLVVSYAILYVWRSSVKGPLTSAGSEDLIERQNPNLLKLKFLPSGTNQPFESSGVF